MGEVVHVPWSALPRFTAESHSGSPLVRVGVVMKSERQQQLSRRGLMQLIPTDGVVFIPLDLNKSLEGQQPFDALLHKVNGLNVFSCIRSDAHPLHCALHRFWSLQQWHRPIAPPILWCTLIRHKIVAAWIPNMDIDESTLRLITPVLTYLFCDRCFRPFALIKHSMPLTSKTPAMTGPRASVVSWSGFSGD